MMPPQKHIIDSGPTTVNSATQTRIILAKGVINPDPFSDATQCRAGSIIGDMTIQLDINLNYAVFGASDPYFDWMVFFNVNDAQTPPTCDNVMGSAGADLLNQVFHQDGCLLATSNSASTAPTDRHSWRLQVGIPKSFRKIMRGDVIALYFKFSVAIASAVKIRAIYKEYFP